ncbi:hypothetical protein B0O80DRAFT_424303 [Mortierella sp. GBAus27b]|nr:hypothetical protein B0O80DRAFT_424303 [Mortierella sp. GBAus27b]
MVVTSFLSLFLLGFSSAHALKGAYPKPGHVPPVDSLQVKTWLQDINLSGAPNTTTTGKRLDCKDSSASNIWACNKSASTDDITQCTVPNTWGLAFHDDSSEQTGQLARFLREHNITATFFLTGSNVAKNKEMIKEYLHGSHHLGSNTWSHTALTGLTNEQIVAEMKWTEMAVLEVTGLRLKYVRPPYGAIDDRVRFVLKAMGYVVVDWTKELDTTAWEVNGDELVTHFTARIHQ